LIKWRNEGITDVDFRKRIENYLDSGYGECWLKEVKIASLVQDTLWHHDGKRYRLIAWVVMPNHAHLLLRPMEILLRPMENEHLSHILHSIKSYSAQKANNILGRNGTFWQRESFDRYIRNADHFVNVIRYIKNNPVKAGLCEKPSDWRFGSAFFKKRVGY
jgi:putative DNA methylase